MADNLINNNSGQQPVKTKEEELSYVTKLVNKKAKEQYATSGSFAATFDGLDGIPFVRREAVAKFAIEYASQFREGSGDFQNWIVKKLAEKGWPGFKDADEIKEVVDRASYKSEGQQGAGVWVKASERLPEGTVGYGKELVYKIHLDGGPRLRVITVNQFLDEIKYRIKEKYEWSDESPDFPSKAREQELEEEYLLDISRYAADNTYRCNTLKGETATFPVDMPKVIQYIRENYNISPKNK